MQLHPEESLFFGDREKIMELWREYINERKEGETLHLPPGLILACRNIMEKTLTSLHDHGIHELDMDGIAIMMADVFALGQYVNSRGLNTSDMNQCSCHAVKDEEIERFLNRHLN